MANAGTLTEDRADPWRKHLFLMGSDVNRDPMRGDLTTQWKGEHGNQAASPLAATQGSGWGHSRKPLWPQTPHKAAWLGTCSVKRHERHQGGLQLEGSS